MYVLGLMSGTSADGIDAVLATFTGKPHQPKWDLKNTASIAYPSELRKLIIEAGQGVLLSSQEWLDLGEAITELHARAVLVCDPDRRAEIVGCHGQTVFHRPPSFPKRGASWQLIQAPLLATIINLPVVFDFRSQDLALDGQGAPLVPLADEALVGRISGWRALLNLGGIANLTLLPPKCGPDKSSSVLGWDCGPANTFIDLAVSQISQGKLDFDRNGEMASKGSPNLEAIKSWLKEPFFHKRFPKSTGREQFGLKDFERRLAELNFPSSNDLVSTMTTFTAEVIANELKNLSNNLNITPVELLVSGGGSKNLVLMDQIRIRSKGITVLELKKIGIHPEFREALAFALLAWWHSKGVHGNSPSITGARKSSVLGVKVYPAG